MHKEDKTKSEKDVLHHLSTEHKSKHKINQHVKCACYEKFIVLYGANQQESDLYVLR